MEEGDCFACLGANSWQIRTSLMAQTVKNLPAMQETWVQSLGWEDPWEKGMATYSSILAWGIPWAEEPGYSPRGSQRLSNFLSLILLKYFHSSALVLGWGRVSQSWVSCFLFLSLVRPSFFPYSPLPPPFPFPTPTCSAFSLPWLEQFASASAFTSTLVYEDSTVMLRRPKDASVSRIYMP